MRTVRVKAAQVVPDPNNPRKCFDNIEALAASFDSNSVTPGEPFIPPILVQDGSYYRIVDGERRVRAMKMLGLDEFTANLADDVDEAYSLAAMVATDSKQALTELEKSRGVQQMLALGVDPVQVEKASGIKGAARVKRGMQVAGGKAETMSIEHLMAIQEFDGDEEAMQQLTDCNESEWQRKADYLRNERNARKQVEQLTAEVIAAGGTIVDSVDRDEWRYSKMLKPGDDMGDLSECLVVMNPNPYSGRASAECYVEREEVQSDPEEEARKLRADAFKQTFDDLFYGLEGYALGILADDIEGKTSIAAVMLDEFLERYGKSAKGDLDAHKLDEPEQRGLGGWAGIYEWGVYRCGVDDCICRYMAGADAFGSQWYADRAAISLKRMDAAIADGFQLLDEEKGAVESLRKAVDELRGEK